MIAKPTEEQVFTSGELNVLLSVSLRQLQWWDERGYVKPKHEGHQRQYSVHEAVTIGVLAHLRRAGVSFQSIRKALRVTQRLIDANDIGILMYDSRMQPVIALDSEQLVHTALRRPQPFYLVPLEEIRSKLNGTKGKR